MQILTVKRASRLRLSESFPGDKSLSHRAVMMGALAKGRSVVKNFLESEDCLATAGIFVKMGAGFKKMGPAQYEIKGRGLRGLHAPKGRLDCGNSGTTMRLLSGVLSAQSFVTTLAGDPSLSRRPMGRVIDPLTQMGARILAEGKKRTAPLQIRGGTLRPISYKLPMASAQVKSAVLLAGLFTRGITEVIEPVPTRDPTERFFAYTGIRFSKRNGRIRLKGPQEPKPFRCTIPGDPSSAAFLLAAGLLVEDSQVTARNILSNPTRDGFLDAIRAMGASMKVRAGKSSGPERAVDIEVRTSRLRSLWIRPRQVPALIDELPILMVLASRAGGVSRFEGVGELRVKETDRVASMTKQLEKMGAKIRVKGETVEIEGTQALSGARIESQGDHRTAMSFAVAGLVADSSTVIRDVACVATSFPNFFTLLKKAGVDLTGPTR